MLDVALRNSERLSNLVDNLLVLVRLDSADSLNTFSSADISISNAVAAAVDTVRPEITERRQELVVNLPAEAAVVRGDAEQLDRVLVNLLSNASSTRPRTAGCRSISRRRATRCRSRSVTWVSASARRAGAPVHALLPRIDRSRQLDQRQRPGFGDREEHRRASRRRRECGVHAGSRLAVHGDAPARSADGPHRLTDVRVRR